MQKAGRWPKFAILKVANLGARYCIAKTCSWALDMSKSIKRKEKERCKNVAWIIKIHTQKIISTATEIEQHNWLQQNIVIFLHIILNFGMVSIDNYIFFTLSKNYVRNIFSVSEQSSTSSYVMFNTSTNFLFPNLHHSMSFVYLFFSKYTNARKRFVKKPLIALNSF